MTVTCNGDAKQVRLLTVNVGRSTADEVEDSTTELELASSSWSCPSCANTWLERRAEVQKAEARTPLKRILLVVELCQ